VGGHYGSGGGGGAHYYGGGGYTMAVGLTAQAITRPGLSASGTPGPEYTPPPHASSGGAYSYHSPAYRSGQFNVGGATNYHSPAYYGSTAHGVGASQLHGLTNGSLAGAQGRDWPPIPASTRFATVWVPGWYGTATAVCGVPVIGTGLETGRGRSGFDHDRFVAIGSSAVLVLGSGHIGDSAGYPFLDFSYLPLLLVRPSVRLRLTVTARL